VGLSHVFFDVFQSWWYGGARVFDVSVAGTTTMANVDLYSLIGNKDIAYTTTVTVTTTGPTLTIAMVASKDKAKISAIEIHAAAIGSPVSVPAPTKSPLAAPIVPAPTKSPLAAPAAPTKSPLAAPAPPTTSSGPLLINCGSASSYTDSQNRTWLADAYYDAGSGNFSANNAIANTVDDTLYQTERTAGTITYSIPRPPGTYAVTLHFAEI
jgi:Malectin domain